MDRVTLRIPRQQVEQVEQLVENGQYPNRSEAIRTAVREMISENDANEGTGQPDRSWAKV